MTKLERVEKTEYLNRYRMAQRRAARLEEEIMQWRSIAERVTQSYSPVPKGTGGAGRLITAVEEIDKLTAVLNARVEESAAIRQSIEKSINALKDERLREILRLRYINGESLESVAVNLCLEYRWLRRLHNRALTVLTLESPADSVL